MGAFLIMYFLMMASYWTDRIWFDHCGSCMLFTVDSIGFGLVWFQRRLVPVQVSVFLLSTPAISVGVLSLTVEAVWICVWVCCLLMNQTRFLLLVLMKFDFSKIWPYNSICFLVLM